MPNSLVDCLLMLFNMYCTVLYLYIIFQPAGQNIFQGKNCAKFKDNIFRFRGAQIPFPDTSALRALPKHTLRRNV